MQEIIVYRNPIEAAFWHSVQSGAAFPVMMGCVAFFLVFLATHRLGAQVGHVERHVVAIAFGIVAAILTVGFFWI